MQTPAISNELSSAGFNPLMPTVAVWVQQLKSILCQTGLSRHL